MRDTILQTPLWQQVVITGEEASRAFLTWLMFMLIFFQVIIGSEDILTLREFVSSQEERNYENT